MSVDEESKANEIRDKVEESENDEPSAELVVTNSINEIVNSDSKAPLKTPVKDESDIQVKFVLNESVNGRGKCVAETAFQSFSGLTKEELLKYANDPFWIRLRMLLFLFFWIIWIAMFIGAITIIIFAPKCEAPKKPKWYQQGPLYELDVSKLIEIQGSENVIQDVKSNLNYFSELKIKGVIFSPIFKVDGNNEESVIDFKSLDPKFGTLEDFKELIKEANEKNINVILSFVPNHSSNKHEWFNKSLARESPYEDYYVWAPASGTAINGSKLPPNNWLSVTGGSAWEWAEQRQEFYLHQFDVDQPDLNYHNPLVLQELNSIFSYWMNMSVKGFNLDKIQYLLEDKGLQNEIPNGKPGAVHSQYEFYSHSKTRNLPDVANILLSWKDNIKKQTEEMGVLIVTGDVPIPTDSNSTTIPVDISRNERLLKNLKKGFSAEDLFPGLSEIINSELNWPPVQLGDRQMARVADSFGEETVDGLNMLTLLLPATPIVYFGEELGLSDSSKFTWGSNDSEVFAQKKAEESHYKVFEALANARDTQTVLYGDTSLKVLNGSVLALTRVNLGNPGYLVAYNPSPNNVTVDLSELNYVPRHLMLHTKSVGNSLGNFSPGGDKIKSESVRLDPKSAALFTFVPKTEE